MALTSGMKFGLMPEVEADSDSQSMSMFPEDLEKLKFGDVLKLLHAHSDTPIKKDNHCSEAGCRLSYLYT